MISSDIVKSTGNQTAPSSPTQTGLHLPPLTRAERAADNIIDGLREYGFKAYRVGGAVRDRLLGRAVHDVDVATDAPPAAVRSLFPNSWAVGEAFGVIIVRAPEKVDIEVATFRTEGKYLDGRRPTSVQYADAPADAGRRDFTINALFYDPAEQLILDFTGGLADLRQGVIRAIGEPGDRFAEDHLRMLRAVRFAAALRFELETKTAYAIQSMADKIARVSQERIFCELTRMLTGPSPAMACRLLQSLNLLPPLLPEISAMTGVNQPPQFHPEGDVWQHTLLMLGKMIMPDPLLAWSTFLHDVGKPPTHEYRDGRDRFPKHASTGAGMARAILRRLKASRQLIDEVGAIIDNHMNFMHVRQMRQATLRRLMARPTFPAELEVHRLDCLASHGKLDGYCFLLDQLADTANQTELPPPLLNGHDLLAMGLTPGPRIGELLQWLQDRQLNGEITDRTQALAAIAEKLKSDFPGETPP